MKRHGSKIKNSAIQEYKIDDLEKVYFDYEPVELIRLQHVKLLRSDIDVSRIK